MYGDSRTLSTDASLIFASNSKPKREELTKSIATIGGRQVSMDSDVSFDNYRQQQNTQPNYGLLRFRSAPTSLLQNSTDGVDKNAGNSNPEARDLSTRFNSYGANGNLMFQDLEDSKRMVNGYSLNSQLPPQYPRQSSGTQVGAAAGMNGSYGAVENQGQVKLGSSLMKQNGSAAGLFSHPAAQNGYASVRGAGSYRVGNAASGNLSPSSSRLKGQMSFASGVPSSLGLLSEISEVENGNVGAGSIDNGKLGSGNVYSSGFPFASWNDSSQFSENFNGLKGSMDDETKLFANTQNGEIGNRMSILSHNLSLPKTSAETAAMEKLLQFQDSVPCKIRAKRGCATHPRSIAERVRRTRISERMRKLQELVPNMDKQTNTADMLDLAVEYIKDLQKQYKTLSYNRANCKCSGTQKPVPNRTV